MPADSRQACACCLFYINRGLDGPAAKTRSFALTRFIRRCSRSNGNDDRRYCGMRRLPAKKPIVIYIEPFEFFFSLVSFGNGPVKDRPVLCWQMMFLVTFTSLTDVSPENHADHPRAWVSVQAIQRLQGALHGTILHSCKLFRKDNVESAAMVR